jgi:hypothetical protein
VQAVLPVKLGKQIQFHLISLSVFLCEASSDVNQEHKHNQASCFEVCLSFAIGSLCKARLRLTNACSIYFLGMLVLIAFVSYVA